MHLTDFPYLSEKVARHLAGRPVTVRFRRPYLRGYDGMAYNDRKRGAVVDVSPELSEADALRLFLHEVAHIKTDWAEMAPSSLADKPPASVEPSRRFVQNHKVDPSEPAADKQAREWLEWAEKKAKSKDTAGMLEALQSWLPADLEGLINQVVSSTLDKLRRNGEI